MLKYHENVYTMVRLVLEGIATLPGSEQAAAVIRAEQWCREALTSIRKDDPREWPAKDEDYRWWNRAETLFVGASQAGYAGVVYTW